MKIVMCEEMKQAYVKEIGEGLADMQDTVKGYVEAIYPFDDNVCLICNDEGKFNGMGPNRSLKDKNGSLIDIIYGPFFIVGIKGEDFVSLTEEQAEKYANEFMVPEKIARLADGHFGMVPFLDAVGS